MPFLGIDKNSKGQRAFNAPAGFVDLKKGPGESKHPAPVPHLGQILDNFTLGLTESGGGWYNLMALILYFVFPFDLSPQGAAAQAPMSTAFFLERLPMWTVVTLGFYTVATMVVHGFATRAFVPNRKWRISRVLHNVMYAMTGILVYVAFENCFAYLWASGKLSYLTDAAAFASPVGMLCFFASLFFAQPYRDVHFYFVHRLIHVRPLYNFIHSVHHRNTDTEVFSGICMHPVEHLYYVTPILPSFFLSFLSPVAVVNAGVWMLISPAFAHSGYEDHFHASSAHYYHHRYFECNYGAGSWVFLDVWFGTWVDEWKNEQQPIKERLDAKADLFKAPTTDSTLYMLLSCACFGLWIYAASALDAFSQLSERTILLASIAIGSGPLIIAVLLFFLRGEPSSALLKPFDQRSLLETASHVLTGVAVSALPLTYIIHTVLSGSDFHFNVLP